MNNRPQLEFLGQSDLSWYEDKEEEETEWRVMKRRMEWKSEKYGQ